MEGSSPPPPPHVLVFPYWLQGHINPMLQFSKRLVSKGLKVTLLSTNSKGSSTEQSPPSSINIGFIEFPEGADATDVDKSLDLFKTLVSQRLGKFIDEALAPHSKNPPRFLIYDSAMPWALDVARGSGIDAAPFFTQPWSVNAVYYHLHNGTFKLPLQEPVLQLPSMPALKGSDVPSFLCGAGPYPGLFRLLITQFSNLKEVNWIFCNTFQKLEQEVIAWMASHERLEIISIGPTVPSMWLDGRLHDDTDYGLNLFKSDVDEHHCIKWLDSKEAGSVVYAAFGSLAVLGEEQMQELAWGIKRSNKPFLWVVRESEQNKLPKGFMGDTSQQGVVVSWSPQIQVLGHRAVGCFVTHCGWNSAVEALSLGVPMVAMPQWTDQLMNAKFVSDVWEVGRRVKVNGDGVCLREEVEVCIREVMEGSEVVQKNCKKWREMAAEAVSEGGSSDKNINGFVRKLCQEFS